MSSSWVAEGNAVPPPLSPAAVHPDGKGPGRARVRRSRAAALVLAAVTLAVGIPVTVLLTGRGEGGGPRAPERGEPAPDFQARTTEGDRLSLRALRGRPVILHFCAHWNPQCRDELELLYEVRSAYRRGQLEIVDVAVGSLAQARRLYRGVPADWIVIADPKRAIATRYGVDAIPQTFFIDRAGQVRARSLGGLGERTLAGRVRELVAR